MRARALGAAGLFALQITVLVAMLLFVAFDRGFYIAEYDKLGVYDSCGADADTLHRATDITIEYLGGKRPSMEGEGTIDGQLRQIFGEDERAHMVDVANLLRTALALAIGCGIFAAAALMLAGKDKLRTAQGALIGIGAFVLVIAAIAACFAADFNWAFTAFHHLLFDNGLWLMDPRTQFMIRMFPGQFFADMGLRIATLTGIGIAAELFVIIMCLQNARRAARGE